jgi:hypothetical protein
MPANKDKKDLNVDELIGEAISTIDTLIKSENEKLKTLGKKEESSKEQSKEESKKEESSKESSKAEMKKDEMSSSPAPDASAQPPQDAPAPDQQPDQQQDDGADLHGLVSSLDDGMLQELMQVVQMEMESRQSQQQPAPEESTDNISPAPEASQQMAPADMAMKSEFESMKAKLAKSEENFANLQASVLTITETITKSASTPRPKAVTEIKDVQVVGRGEDLNKKEKGNNPSASEVFKKMDSIAKDRFALQSLNKSEMDTLQGYFHTKQINDKVLQLFNK